LARARDAVAQLAVLDRLAAGLERAAAMNGQVAGHYVERAER
jgi:hypothetical protein